jgi:hypothetical protein
MVMTYSKIPCIFLSSSCFSYFLTTGQWQPSIGWIIPFNPIMSKITHMSNTSNLPTLKDVLQKPLLYMHLFPISFKPVDTNAKKFKINFENLSSMAKSKHSWLFCCFWWFTLVFCIDRLCDVVVRVPGYRSRGPGFDSRRYQIFCEVVGLERGPLSLVRITEELLEWKSSGSSLGNRD